MSRKEQLTTYGARLYCLDVPLTAEYAFTGRGYLLFSLSLVQKLKNLILPPLGQVTHSRASVGVVGPKRSKMACIGHNVPELHLAQEDCKVVIRVPRRIGEPFEFSTQVIGSGSNRQILGEPWISRRAVNAASRNIARRSARPDRMLHCGPRPPAVLDEMQPVLHAPMAPDQAHQPFRAHLVGREARDDVASLMSAW